MSKYDKITAEEINQIRMKAQPYQLMGCRPVVFDDKKRKKENKRVKKEIRNYTKEE